jgi:hypothetical protein
MKFSFFSSTLTGFGYFNAVFGRKFCVSVSNPFCIVLLLLDAAAYGINSSSSGSFFVYLGGALMGSTILGPEYSTYSISMFSETPSWIKVKS